MKCRRGDVVIVRFIHSDRIHIKQRPALVIQSDSLPTNIPQKLVAMITSTIWVGPSRVSVKKNSAAGRRMGITRDSVVMTDNIITVLEIDIYKIIGQQPDMNVIDAALAVSLDLKLA